MLTEDEAKKKWCPMARVALDYGEGSAGHQAVTSANSGWADETDTLYTATRCLGSGCMMWRFAVEIVDKATGEPVAMSRAMALVRKGPDAVETRWADHGYCGLAVKPE